MNTADEILDVVDPQDCVIGQARRGDIHVRKLWHRAVHVLLFNPDGELFVQKRSATKDTFPGCYDSSASGHVDHREDYDACAVRELGEELGLNVPFALFRRHFQLPPCAETGWEFVWVYSLQGDYTPVVNPVEIESGAFMSVTAVERLLAAHPEQCAPSFVRVFREFRQHNLLP